MSRSSVSIRRWVFTACATLTLATGACGESSGIAAVTTTDYFATMEAQSVASTALLDRVDTSGQAPLLVTATSLHEIFAETASQLERVAPTAELREEHQAYVEAYRRLVDFWHDELDRLGANATDEEIEASMTSPEWNNAQEDVRTTCQRLRSAAADEGITVYLQCDLFGGVS